MAIPGIEHDAIGPEITVTAMAEITISISEERLEQLRRIAIEAGTSAEDLVRASLENWLRQPREDFTEAAQRILQKNAELYRRLA